MFNTTDQFEQALQAAQRAVKSGRYKLAILHQNRAITVLRQLLTAKSDDALYKRISIELYNLAMYHVELSQWPPAIEALKGTVEIDQRFNLADLASDQEMLAEVRFKQMATAVQLAEAAATQEKFVLAAHHQEVVVQTLRDMLQVHRHPKILTDLATQLFNMAGYYGHIGRHSDAAVAMEEVVAIDKKLNLPDLVSDQAVLEEARLGTSVAESQVGQRLLHELQTLSPDELIAFDHDLQQFKQQISHLSQAEQNQFRQLIQDLAERTELMDEAKKLEMADYAARIAAEYSLFNTDDQPQIDLHLFDLAQTTAGFNKLSPEQQLHQLQEMRVDYLIHEIHEGVLAWRAGDISPESLPEMINALKALAPDVAQDESFGRHKQTLAQYILALIAYLNGQQNPPIPPAFREQFSELQ